VAYFTDRRFLGWAGFGALMFVAIFFMGVREVHRFQSTTEPGVLPCLGLTPQECQNRVEADAASEDPATDKKELASARAQVDNRLASDRREAARRRTAARRRQNPSPTGGGTSPSSGNTSPPSGASNPAPQAPSQAPQPTVTNRPNPSPAPAPQRPPPTTTRPPATTRPPVVPPVTTPPVTVPPTPVTPPVTVPPVTTPPVNVPPICTPVVGVNCPPGSRQALRLSARGPGNEDDPVRVGADPDGYDLDPTKPSDNVNGAPTP
jgi:hypothetical protein